MYKFFILRFKDPIDDDSYSNILNEYILIVVADFLENKLQLIENYISNDNIQNLISVFE